MSGDEVLGQVDKTFIDKLAFVYIRDGKVLSSMSCGKDTWYIPGGKREAGEDDETALQRGVTEELSVELKPETIKHYGTFEAQAHGKLEGTIMRMSCYMAEFDGEPRAANEIERIAFFSYHDEFKRGPVDILILDDLYAKGLIR